jgi:hypothetical protein
MNAVMKLLDNFLTRQETVASCWLDSVESVKQLELIIASSLSRVLLRKQISLGVNCCNQLPNEVPPTARGVKVQNASNKTSNGESLLNHRTMDLRVPYLGTWHYQILRQSCGVDALSVDSSTSSGQNMQFLSYLSALVRPFSWNRNSTTLQGNMFDEMIMKKEFQWLGYIKTHLLVCSEP